MLQTARDRRTVHCRHLLDHELKREQAAASKAEGEPPSAGLAGPLLAGSVGEVEVEGLEHPLRAQDEDETVVRAEVPALVPSLASNL